MNFNKVQPFKIDRIYLTHSGYWLVLSFSFFCQVFFLACSPKTKKEPELNDEAYDNALKYTDRSNLDADSLNELYFDIQHDTLRRKIAFKLAYRYFNSMDSLEFRKWNHRALSIAEKTQDHNRIGLAHFNLGNFFDNLHIPDSSYYHYFQAYNSYSSMDNKVFMARTLHNMAMLQESVRDFTGSEVTVIRELEIAQELQDDKLLYLGFTLLGIVSNALGNYPEALKYQREAESYAKNLNDDLLLAQTSNNIGVVYRNMEDWSTAKRFYNKTLAVEDLLKLNPRLYATALENLAYANFIQGRDQIFYDYSNRALKIRDSLSDIPGVIINRLHLGEYHLKESDTSLAIKEFKIAENLAATTENLRYVLESLLWLSKADREHSAAFLTRYVDIKDSLDFEDRKIRNKFERIRFETDEYIERNELLKKQNLWIVYTGAAAMLIVILLYFYREQKLKNRELFFDYEQQKSNEKIYELLLQQEEKREEGRKQEQLRISGELHDGILSQVFGVRMSLGFLMNGLKHSENGVIEQMDKHVENIHQIETEIREISHNLASHTLLTNSTFLVILENFVAERNGLNGLNIKLDVNGEIAWDLIENEIKINLFRILQEATQNALKYSRGTQLNISLYRENGLLYVIVMDNGIGFERTRTKDGIGIKSMSRRVHKLGGEIFINSDTSGTTIKIKIPI